MITQRQIDLFLRLVASLQPPQDLPNVQELPEDEILQLIRVLPPPPNPFLEIQMRLFPNPADRQAPWTGRDVFLVWSQHRFEFFRTVGETPETFLNIVGTIGGNLITFGRNRLSVRNRILLTLMWLRSYPCYSLLSLIFDISVSTVGEVIHQTWPVLWDFYAPEVSWPTEEEWGRLDGNWPDIPHALGAIDGTSHEIYRPSTEPQHLYYSGHRNMHCMHTIVIINNLKRFCYIGPGYLGHNNDSD